MKLTLLFGLIPKEIHEQVVGDTKRYFQNAADLLQWNIVDGIEAAAPPDLNVSIINSMYISGYPGDYATPIIKTGRFSHAPGADDINVGFLNLKGVKELSRGLGLHKYLRKICKEGDHTVLFYAMTTPFMSAAKYIKKHNPAVRVCAVVPDLPQYMHLGTGNSGGLRGLLRNMRQRSVYGNIGYVDRFVLISGCMAQALGCDDYTVMEGMAPAIAACPPDLTAEVGTKRIMYMGAIRLRYGLETLCRALDILKKDGYVLDICGDGEDARKLEEIIRDRPGIVYHGAVSRQELLKIAGKAAVFVNPRQNDGEATRYYFPSKTLEYLSFGTPTVSYRLDGIPKEYDDYLFYPADNSPRALAECIARAGAVTPEERMNYYRKAREFSQTVKSPAAQGKKILDYILN